MSASGPECETHMPIRAGTWPGLRSGTLDWLVLDTGRERFFDRIFVGMCERLVEEGVPLAQATMHLRINHPELLALTVTWRKGVADPELRPVPLTAHADLRGFDDLCTPLRQGRPEIRQRHDAPSHCLLDHDWLEGLASAGLCERVALPLDFTEGHRHTVTFATADRDGLLPDQVDRIRAVLPAFALVAEIRLKNRLAGRLLETYVGTLARDDILRGATRRGSCVALTASILAADIRGFTRLSDTLHADELLGLLNDFFDAIARPVSACGGEVLKFTGDGLLAVFPADAIAGAGVVAAISEIRSGVEAMNDARVADGCEAITYGIGVHRGTVSYGNVGSRSRLDYTVIGSAVNVAARLESLTKVVGCAVLFSGEFVASVDPPCPFRPLGTHALRGVMQPVEVFASFDEKLDCVSSELVEGDASEPVTE